MSVFLSRDKDAILRELEVESATVEMVQIGMIARDEAIALLRPSRWRRFCEWIAGWFRRGPVLTVGAGVMSRRQHREAVRFARESGNEALFVCLRRK